LLGPINKRIHDFYHDEKEVEHTHPEYYEDEIRPEYHIFFFPSGYDAFGKFIHIIDGFKVIGTEGGMYIVGSDKQ
jgi:hypothetical protein